MTNRQLAAARRVFNRFREGGLKLRKVRGTLTPMRGKREGAPVRITDDMPPAQVENLLRASILAFNG